MAPLGNFGWRLWRPIYRYMLLWPLFRHQCAYSEIPWWPAEVWHPAVRSRRHHFHAGRSMRWTEKGQSSYSNTPVHTGRDSCRCSQTGRRCDTWRPRYCHCHETPLTRQKTKQPCRSLFPASISFFWAWLVSRKNTISFWECKRNGFRCKYVGSSIGQWRKMEDGVDFQVHMIVFQSSLIDSLVFHCDSPTILEHSSVEKLLVMSEAGKRRW